MAFHFHLEAILRLRRGQERMERLRLETIAAEQAHVRRRLEIITEEFLESRRAFQEQMAGEKLGVEVQLEAMRGDRVHAARVRLQNSILELEQLRLRQIEVYKRAQQGREMLETLRNRQFEAYRQLLSRREQQQLDDLFLMRCDLLNEQ